ncbi:acetyl-CoA carboxylase carboxyltransferase subunit alpha [Candidatus Bipolaricaulota bacterium]|nr:acetyl-CoA carboxylase carboxyltransferase subunit alpha [Candidatus Bipolaricaulota bacterium]MBS3814210.1 acetyl-CoA carboxylase carboxyltransferase subunit alpha [Candidatus Bipolaricaulota bacterium]MBS3825024.1 acetyl-CoA carboxylase carboxyltransferase subunit alpha [Candidatus Bipolaricaulota bacterium]
MSEEKTLQELREQIEQLEALNSRNGLDLSREIDNLTEKLAEREKDTKEKLEEWDKVNLARHPDRPGSEEYLDYLMEDFYPLHGDRLIGDDGALIGGLAKYNGETVMVIAQNKGGEVEQSQQSNFGMLRSEGYRKAQRLMKLAETFQFPVLTLIDTPGAYPGKEAEERNIGGMIAKSISEMVSLEVPTVAAVIGEGGSGGAVAIGAADRVVMLENSIYSVISPEGCAAILWEDRDKADEAARALKLTAGHAQDLGIIDEIIPEGGSGAHEDFETTADNLDHSLSNHLEELENYEEDQLLAKRRKKYRSIGSFKKVMKKEQS